MYRAVLYSKRLSLYIGDILLIDKARKIMIKIKTLLAVRLHLPQRLLHTLPLLPVHRLLKLRTQATLVLTKPQTRPPTLTSLTTITKAFLLTSRFIVFIKSFQM